jgi:hypothetical protein
VLPLAEPEVLGCAAELELLESLPLGLLALGEAELAPPEAEPDFAASLEPDPLIPEEELDEEPGELGLDEAPDDGDEGELLGEEVLELEEPGVDEVLLELSPRSHAARPKASATAAASMESFMCPPWLGIKRKGANCEPGLTP